jgi:hypothetical protein
MILEKGQNYSHHHQSVLTPEQRKTPTAVVRPMEHPLQKLTHQISQIESTFNNLSSSHVAVSSTTPPSSIISNAPREEEEQVPVVITSSQLSSSDSDPIINNNPPRSIKKDIVPSTINRLTKPRGTESKKRKKTTNNNKIKSTTTTSTTTTTTTSNVNGSPAKPIKVTLKRKERGDSYSVKDISAESDGGDGGVGVGAEEYKFKSLKITARVTSGELEGTMMDVVVEPKIHIITIPDPEDIDSNFTIQEQDDQDSGVIPSIPVGYAEHGGSPKLVNTFLNALLLRIYIEL